MKERFEVELHSTHPQAIQATAATISMLPGGGELVQDGQRFFNEAQDIGFLEYAVEHQGYVKRVVSP